jgi:hypothetical protein
VSTLLQTASGLTREEVSGLSSAERGLLYDWTREQSGGATRTFIPAAVRRMPLETRMMFAQSEERTAFWQERERRRVRSNTADSFFYFVNQYGHVQPPKGKPQPFITWPAQRKVALAMVTEPKLALPKARRMGISWLAMHYVDWTCEHNPLTDFARCLILSKGQDDAKEMLKRVKAVHENQPEWLRGPVSTDNTQEVYFGNASVKSLPATESAARSETATLVILDEFAFVRNKQAAGINTAVEPTVEGAAGQGGQILYISSGNGEVGNGAEFAQICRTAERGEGDVRMVFLAASERPDRDKATLEAKRAKDDRAVVEYAETLDEALAGDKTVNVYPKSHVSAAEYIGKRFETYPQLDRLYEQGVEWGTDWGDFQTFTLYAVGLPGAGLFVFDELVQQHMEPQQASTNIVRHDPGGVLARDGGKLRAIASRQDASPAGTNATYASVVRAHRDMPEYTGRIPGQTVRIPFGEFKQGGKDRGKANTIGFLQWLFKRSQDFAEGDKTLDEAHGIIAIHPRCKLLLAQLRNLERDPSTGKVKKPALDPNHPEIGDHGPDALVALSSLPRAVQWTKQSI